LLLGATKAAVKMELRFEGDMSGSSPAVLLDNRMPERGVKGDDEVGDGVLRALHGATGFHVNHNKIDRQVNSMARRMADPD